MAPVARVLIKGARRVEVEALRRHISLKKGQSVAEMERTIRKDVSSIYTMRRFRDVWVSCELRLQQAWVTYHVRERPMIREITYKGHKEVSRDDLKGVVDLKKYAILDRVQVQKNVEKLIELYREKGFPLVEVSAVIEDERKPSVKVQFNIKEHAKLRIRRISFVGNKQVKRDALLKILHSEEFNIINFFTGRSLYRELFTQRDLYLLQSYYLDRGFIHAKIKGPVVHLTKDRKSLHMTYSIHEGQQYRYGRVRFVGRWLFSRRRLRRVLRLKKGELFSRSKLFHGTILKLQTLVQTRGYAYANIIPQMKLDHTKRLIHLDFRLRRGPRVRIERNEIVGNGTTRDAVIRREILVHEGDWYNGALIQRSQRRIFALGYFAKTHPLYGVKVVSRRGSAPNRIILRWVVKEKPSGNFQIGLGYGGTSGLFFRTQIAQRNLFGWGKSLSLGLELSMVSQQGQLQYVDPHFLGSPFSLGVSVHHLMTQYTAIGGAALDYMEMRTGASLTFGVPIWQRLSAFLTYKLERVQINPFASDEDRDTELETILMGREGATWTSSLKAGLQLDLRNNRLFPTSGSFHRVSFEVADTFLGSQSQFYRLSLTSRWYAQLPLGIVFKTHFQLGLTHSPSDNGVPLSERYRLGGINTVRGYGDLTIGPTRSLSTSSVDGALINWGGNKQIIFNAELEFPIVPQVGIKGVVFFDAGNVFSESEMFFQDTRNPGLPLGLFMSAGVGIRWYSPIGPLRFEFGFPLVRRETDDTWRFHFSIGQSF